LAKFLGWSTSVPLIIHAEAYPAGELKHGPIALIDKETPVIAVAPNDD
jgi:glucosamine--fructose-6-phosphate aminotransferase (isomerizing)